MIDNDTKQPAARPRLHEAPEIALKRIRFTVAAKQGLPAASGYLTRTRKPVFRQGATVLPHVLTIAERTEVTTDRARVSVTTRKSKQAPWSGVEPRTIELPRRWLTELCTSNDVAAFVARTSKAIIPLDGAGNLLTHRDIDEDNWKLLDELYRIHAGGGKQTPRTLLDRIDYLRNLSVQLPLRPETQRKLVLYPKSGDVMRAARQHTGRAVIDHGLYWYHAPSAGEAAYLTVLLNTDCLQQAYADSRESGRDFHLHLWRKIPIPRYDKTVALHAEIAALCTRAEAIATQTVTEGLEAAPGKRQVALSRSVRNALADTGVDTAMDDCARRLLPAHVE